MIFIKAYKFLSFKDKKDKPGGILDSLKKGKLRFSTIEKFNDPFEGRLKIVRPDLTNEEEKKETILHFAKALHRSTGMDLDSAISEATEIIKKPEHILDDHFTMLESKLPKMTREEFNRRGYLCLSGDENESSVQQLNNILMWSHYADGLRGFCIEFNFELLFESLTTLNKKLFHSSEIEYLSEIQKIKLFDMDPDKESKITKAILTKSFHWSYEKEVRIITDNPGEYSYSHNAISCIYIGEKMNPDKKRRLLSLINKYLPNVDYKFMRLHPDNYSLYASET